MTDCKFILGRWEDSIKNIEDGTIGMVYTDPPYGMEYRSNIPGDIRWNKNQQTISKFSKPILNDKHGDIDFEVFAKEIYRVMKPNTYLVLHCNTIWIGKNIDKFAEAGFIYKGTVAWNKRFAIGGDIHGAMKRSWEPILYMAKGKPKMRSIEVERKGQLVVRKRIDEISDWVFQLNFDERTGFPTQKPKALCSRMITMMSDKNDIILDPFAGSGTIGKTAKSIERNSISFEADEKVFNKFLKDYKEIEVKKVKEEKVVKVVKNLFSDLS
jgi:DNA modification methylase